MRERRLMIFGGNANPPLTRNIAAYLQQPIGKLQLTRFSDGETAVEILENVRGGDVFIVQPVCAPTNDNLMDLLVMVDAMKRSSAERITAVVPYYGYARQDRRVRSARVPITAKLVANMLSVAGVDRVLTVDVHAEQIQGFFDIPVDNVYASPLLLLDIWRQKHENLVVVSPDIGGVVRARAVAKQLDDSDLAIIDKRRPKANEAQVMNIIGDVSGRTCVLIDDMVDTAGTLCKAAEALKNHGAVKVVALATHPVLSGNAIGNLTSSVLDELVVTDTIPLSPRGARLRDASACSRWPISSARPSGASTRTSRSARCTWTKGSDRSRSDPPGYSPVGPSRPVGDLAVRIHGIGGERAYSPAGPSHPVQEPSGRIQEISVGRPARRRLPIIGRVGPQGVRPVGYTPPALPGRGQIPARHVGAAEIPPEKFDMSDDINVRAESRNVFGKGASRRLRRENLVPAIVYGDGKDPQSVQMKHNEVVKHLENEGFYSQLLMLSIDGGDSVRTILKDVQRHPYRQQILHMDFLRVTAGAELQVSVPLHFLGEDVAPGVKNENGVVTHNDNEVGDRLPSRATSRPTSRSTCPNMAVGDTVHLSDLVMPENVRLVDLVEAGDDSDRVVAAILAPRVEVEEDEETSEPDADDGSSPIEGGEDAVGRRRRGRG